MSLSPAVNRNRARRALLWANPLFGGLFSPLCLHSGACAPGPISAPLLWASLYLPGPFRRSVSTPVQTPRSPAQGGAVRRCPAQSGAVRRCPAQAGAVRRCDAFMGKSIFGRALPSLFFHSGRPSPPAPSRPRRFRALWFIALSIGGCGSCDFLKGGVY